MPEDKNRLVEYKTKTVLIDILTRFDQGETAPEIKRTYGWKRGRLDYHIKKLKEAGLIAIKARSSMNIYALSEQGKRILSEHLTGIDGLLLHNVEFSYPILAEGQFEPDKEWSWGKLLIRAKKLSGCSVKLMGKTLVISVEHIPGTDSFKLADEAKNIADRTVEWLKSQGFSMGIGYQSRKPHFGVVGPLAKKIAEQVQVRSDTYQIDKSLGGEVEFFTPETADSYMRMPEKLAEVESYLVKQSVLLEKVNESLLLEISNKKLHQAVLEEMKDTLREIREGLKPKEGKEPM